MNRCGNEIHGKYCANDTTRHAKLCALDVPIPGGAPPIMAAACSIQYPNNVPWHFHVELGLWHDVVVDKRLVGWYMYVCLFVGQQHKEGETDGDELRNNRFCVWLDTRAWSSETKRQPTRRKNHTQQQDEDRA